jgi:hypothetical protein
MCCLSLPLAHPCPPDARPASAAATPQGCRPRSRRCACRGCPTCRSSRARTGSARSGAPTGPASTWVRTRPRPPPANALSAAPGTLRACAPAGRDGGALCSAERPHAAKHTSDAGLEQAPMTGQEASAHAHRRLCCTGWARPATHMHYRKGRRDCQNEADLPAVRPGLYHGSSPRRTCPCAAPRPSATRRPSGSGAVSRRPACAKPAAPTSARCGPHKPARARAGVRARVPRSLLAGLMWFDPDRPDALAHLRHLAQERDGAHPAPLRPSATMPWVPRSQAPAPSLPLVQGPGGRGASAGATPSLTRAWSFA